MVEHNLAYRVIGWDDSHETPQSLKKQGQPANVLLPTNLGTTAIQTLMRSPEGPAVVGVWYVVQMLAANASRRGVLCEQGSPLTADQLARVTGWDVSLIERALTVLCQPGTRYLERVPLDIALQPPILPEPKPRAPRKPKPLPFTHCPVCKADLEAWAKGNCHHPNHQVQTSSDIAPVVDAASVRVKLASSVTQDLVTLVAQATPLCADTDQIDDMSDSHPILGLENRGPLVPPDSRQSNVLDFSRMLAASGAVAQGANSCPDAMVNENAVEVAPVHGLEVQTTSDQRTTITDLFAQARDLCDVDADDFRNIGTSVPNYDHQGRRAELASLGDLIRQLETGQVDSPVLEDYLESHADRVARQGEDLVTSAPTKKSPPAEVPRQQNRPPPNRSQRKTRQQKRRKKR